MRRSRIIISTILATVLFSSFQNCSKMNFSGDETKQLVSGTTSDTAPAATSSSPATTVSATPAPDIGICALTCASYTNQEHELSQSGGLNCNKPAELPLCATEPYGPKTVVQVLSGNDVHPKTVCVSHTACNMIGRQLAKGSVILMKTINNQASTMNSTNFEPVSSPDDCEDTLSDSEVAQLFGGNS